MFQDQTRPATSRPLQRRLYVPIALLIALAVTALSFLPIAANPLMRAMIFYAGACLAYAVMPFARRADIPLLAAWVILFCELAPCLDGRMMSVENVGIDALGVTLAAAPIYIARLRQVMQGDVKAFIGGDRRNSGRAEA